MRTNVYVIRRKRPIREEVLERDPELKKALKLAKILKEKLRDPRMVEELLRDPETRRKLFLIAGILGIDLPVTVVPR